VSGLEHLFVVAFERSFDAAYGLEYLEPTRGRVHVREALLPLGEQLVLLPKESLAGEPARQRGFHRPAARDVHVPVRPLEGAQRAEHPVPGLVLLPAPLLGARPDDAALLQAPDAVLPERPQADKAPLVQDPGGQLRVVAAAPRDVDVSVLRAEIEQLEQPRFPDGVGGIADGMTFNGILIRRLQCGEEGFHARNNRGIPLRCQQGDPLDTTALGYEIRPT